MAKINPLMLAPPVVFAGLAAMFYLGMARENPDAIPTALAGKEAPAVQTTMLGTLPQFTQAQLKDGKVKLVNFWASWCGPCRVEHPLLEALQDQGITIYGVNYKDEPGNALGFLEELGNPYAGIGADMTGRMALDWGVYGVPETYIIDGEGRILLRHAGPLTQRVMQGEFGTALQAAFDE